MYELPCPNWSPSGEQDDPEYLYNEDGTYTYGVATGSGKEAPNVREGIFLRYSVAVIGQGESYICKDGSWADMASEDGLIMLLGNPDMLKNIKESDTQLDNFNIRAYGLVR